MWAPQASTAPPSLAFCISPASGLSGLHAAMLQLATSGTGHGHHDCCHNACSARMLTCRLSTDLCCDAMHLVVPVTLGMPPSLLFCTVQSVASARRPASWTWAPSGTPCWSLAGRTGWSMRCKMMSWQHSTASPASCSTGAEGRRLTGWCMDAAGSGLLGWWMGSAGSSVPGWWKKAAGSGVPGWWMGAAGSGLPGWWMGAAGRWRRGLAAGAGWRARALSAC